MTDTPLSTGVGLTASAAGWTNRFHSLGPAFFTDLSVQPLPDPHWVARSSECARDLGLTADWWQDLVALWAGQLGDGRTLWLGELETPGGAMELQLKDAGITLHSRMGDGRAVLRSSIREFLCSESMHALGIPTTRALCITGSPLPVRREETETASVVTRVTPSFIRFGHFEHFLHADQHAEPKRLADFVIAHHHPACADNANPDAALLATVAERTAGLLAQWQAVGFCHGVMNTDNMPILGLTIDCGPFGFLDAFDPGHICNHSDHQSRYAFARQPNVAFWNLHALAQALLPLIGCSDEALAALEPYKTAFPQAFVARMPAQTGPARPVHRPRGLRRVGRTLPRAAGGRSQRRHRSRQRHERRQPEIPAAQSPGGCGDSTGAQWRLFRSSAVG